MKKLKRKLRARAQKGYRAKSCRIGLISDTHGLLRPEAMRALAGVDLIIHAGDIGKPELIEALEAVAPVRAVRGNNDREGWARRFPDTRSIEAGGVKIYVLHDLRELKLDPGANGFEIVISGHSHKPSVVKRGGVLFVNPGSAGPRRFKLPVAIGYLGIGRRGIESKIKELIPGIPRSVKP